MHCFDPLPVAPYTGDKETKNLLTMAQYEIEIKSLLENLEKVETLKRRLQEIDPATRMVRQNKQLNHYFTSEDVEGIFRKVAPYIDEGRHDDLDRILTEGRNHSVRTRQIDNDVLLVLKAAIDDTTSENGTARMEFEAKTPELSLEELDALLHEAGLEYQAKWSREREEHAFRGLNVCIDKNAGYGYLAEVEKVIDDAEEAEAAKEELRQVLAELGIEELPQDRLARMFAHYNENWREYYGTDKTFNIK